MRLPLAISLLIHPVQTVRIIVKVARTMLRTRKPPVACLSLSLLLLPGCALGPKPLQLGSVPLVNNACLLDALTEFQRCKTNGVPAAVVAIYYQDDGGAKHGHVMLTYEWLDNWTHVARWAWDSTNQSQPLFPRIDDADAVAAAMFARPVSAHVMQIYRP